MHHLPSLLPSTMHIHIYIHPSIHQLPIIHQSPVHSSIHPPIIYPAPIFLLYNKQVEGTHTLFPGLVHIPVFRSLTIWLLGFKRLRELPKLDERQKDLIFRHDVENCKPFYVKVFQASSEVLDEWIVISSLLPSRVRPGTYPERKQTHKQHGLKSREAGPCGWRMSA